MYNPWLELNEVKKEFPIGCVVELSLLIWSTATINLYKNKILTISDYIIGKSTYSGKFFVYLEIEYAESNGTINKTLFAKKNITKK